MSSGTRTAVSDALIVAGATFAQLAIDIQKKIRGVRTSGLPEKNTDLYLNIYSKQLQIVLSAHRVLLVGTIDSHTQAQLESISIPRIHLVAF